MTLVDGSDTGGVRRLLKNDRFAQNIYPKQIHGCNIAKRCVIKTFCGPLVKIRFRVQLQQPTS